MCLMMSTYESAQVVWNCFVRTTNLTFLSNIATKSLYTRLRESHTFNDDVDLRKLLTPECFMIRYIYV